MQRIRKYELYLGESMREAINRNYPRGRTDIGFNRQRLTAHFKYRAQKKYENDVSTKRISTKI